MTPRIFIDGATGTTGLLIRSLLEPRARAGELSIVAIPDHRDERRRAEAFAEADLSILCLPDEVARAAIPLLEGTRTRVLDASSAHRTDPAWVYGFPELAPEQPARIRGARRVSNPGCYAVGAVSILGPLVGAGVLDPDRPVTIVGVSGYTGGGKPMIERFEAGGAPASRVNAFAAYSVNARHKHTEEIRRHAGLRAAPIFLPHVIDVPRGMMVCVPLSRGAIDADRAAVQAIFERAYAGPASKVRVAPPDAAARRLGFAEFAAINGTGGTGGVIDTLTLHVHGWEEGDEGQVVVYALLDNLGKGAATQAIQNLTLMLGLADHRSTAPS